MELAEPGCRLCDHRGLIFPNERGGIRACSVHTSKEWHARLADIDQRAEKVLHRGWPYGPDLSIQARIDLVEWAEPLGVKLSGSRCEGLHWLRKGACHHNLCNRYPWMDHTTRWNLDGKPALVLTQPYKSAERQREMMGDLLEDNELHVEIKPGWYGYGTIGAFVWRADVYRSLAT